MDAHTPCQVLSLGSPIITCALPAMPTGLSDALSALHALGYAALSGVWCVLLTGSNRKAAFNLGSEA